MTKNLYGFSLSGLTPRIIWQLKSLDMCYQVWPNNIDHYLQMLLYDQPKHILGLGTYSGVDQGNIRIETIVKNQFRNRPIEKEFPISKKHTLSPFVHQIPQTRFASALGNSWCNLISWNIVRLIEKGELQSEYTFLHIPKSLNTHSAIKIIEAMVHEIC